MSVTYLGLSLIVIGSLAATEASAQNWVQNGSSITTTSRVSIGTTSSASRHLQIVGNGLVNGGYIGEEITNTAPGGSSWTLFSSDSTAGVGGGKFTIWDRTSSTHRLVIDASGNVGIGAINPTYKLQVSGPTYLDDGTAQVDANTFKKFPASHYVTNGQPKNSVLGVFGGVAFTGTTMVLGQEGAASPNWYHLKAVTSANGTPVTQFVIRGDGKVGIGTDAPTDPLQVAGRITAGREGFGGVYNASQVQGIWSIGSAYKIDTVANNFGNYYGLAYAYTSSGQGVANFGHQIMGINNGQMTSSISTSYGNAYFKGNIGIGTLTPQYKLDVAGTARVSQLIYNSDRRLKTDIAPIDSPLEKLSWLQGVTYHWNDLAREKGIKNSRQQIGLIAQDVEKSFPEAVENGKDGFKSVNYPALVGPLVSAVNELYHRWIEKSSAQDQAIEGLQAQNAELRKQLEDQGNEFRRRLESLESKAH